MTREEALNDWLPIIRQMVKGTEVYEKALDMAIKALEQEPCEDCISRQAVLEVIRKCHCEEWVKADIGAPIEALPSVTPQQKVGRWIEHIHNGMHYIECPKCSSWFLRMYLTRNSYCPNCGCKMHEVQNEISD